MPCSCAPPLVLFPLSFYSYKGLEKGVAPNVSLAPLPLEKVGLLSPSRPSSSHPGVFANTSTCKRATPTFPAPPPCPPSAKAPPPDESEGEVEVESRDEGKLVS